MHAKNFAGGGIKYFRGVQIFQEKVAVPLFGWSKYIVTGLHLLKPQKAHLTGDLVVVPKNYGCMMLRFTCRLANVVRQ